MNIDDIGTQLLYTTVPIRVKKDENLEASGTGFIFSIREEEERSIPLLITNYHVLENITSGYFELHLEENGMPTNKSLIIHFDKSIVNSNKLGELDIVAIPLASTLNNLQNNSNHVFFRSVDQKMIPTSEQQNNFSAMEDITFIGYPSGLYDNRNKIPIIRRGITATPIWNDFEGKREYLIDAGVFPGSSGSPVFIYNNGTYSTRNGIALGSRLFFVGTISETFLTSNNKLTQNNYLNLGKVINSMAILDELEQFIKHIKEQQK